jgi:hypothetical protein
MKKEGTDDVMLCVMLYSCTLVHGETKGRPRHRTIENPGPHLPSVDPVPDHANVKITYRYGTVVPLLCRRLFEARGFSSRGVQVTTE